MLNTVQDYVTYYKILDTVAPQVEVLVAPIINVSKLTSKYYYLTQMIARLTNIKYLHFRSVTDTYSVKISKDIVKGLKQFNSKSEKLYQIETVSFHNMKNCDFD